MPPKRRGSLPTPPRTPKRVRTRKGSIAGNVGKVALAVASRNPYVRAGLSAASVARKLWNARANKKKPARKIKGQSYRNAAPIKGGTNVMGAFDNYSEQGFVTSVQAGNVLTTLRPVGFLAQTTLPQRQVLETTFKALVKKLFMTAGFRIKSDSDNIWDGQYYNGYIELRYKVRDGQPVITKDFLVTPTSTLNSIIDIDTTNGIVRWLLNLAQTPDLPSQLLTMRYYVEFGTTVTAKMLQAELDLGNCFVSLHGVSTLRMQNRTINTTGNNEADDVDNVPLDGKFYDFKSNGTLYRDYNQPAAADRSALTTDARYGLLNTVAAASVTGTSMYDDIPLPSQFVGIKKHGTWGIQPGTIRASTISSSAYLNIQKLVTLLCSKIAYSTGGYQQFWIGDTRLFAFEKKIFATPATADNQIVVAYDHEFKIGASIFERRNNQTAPRVINQPAVAN